jgi:hypothetical protein
MSSWRGQDNLCFFGFFFDKETMASDVCLKAAVGEQCDVRRISGQSHPTDATAGFTNIMLTASAWQRDAL